MRTDNPEYASENILQWREPRFVFSVDFGDDDVFYLTSHPVTGLAGENVIAGVLMSASGTSQKLDPLKANSEIGAISFDVLDEGLTELQRDKLLVEDKGLRGKTVRFYVGAAGLDWADYILATTQVIEIVSYKDLSYKFKCADIQRAMRGDILEPLETGLAESVTADSAYIRVFTTSGFQPVQQLNISGSVAPGKKIGLVAMEGDGDQQEIIAYDAVEADRFIIANTRTNLTAATQEGGGVVMLGAAAATFRSAGQGVIRTLEPDGQGGEIERFHAFRWTGRNSNSLTGCSGVVAAPLNSQVRDVWGRGMFGTPILSVERAPDSGVDNSPVVTEFIYLEMPVPMAAYALLTGSIYGHPGEYLPDHWHLGIGPQFIRTSEFTGIGSDLWDLANDNGGLVIRLMGLEQEDGKQFIEEQLYRLMGCYSPIYSDGQIGLRRMSGVLSSGGYVRRLNEDNVVDYSDLTHDMKATVNTIIARWNYSMVREEYTRTNLLIDDESIERHGKGEPLEVEFRGLYGGRHSYQTLWTILNSLRDRYAGPPLRITLTLTPDQNDLEVGDIVRVDLGAVRDYTNDETIHLNRNFEIQQIQTDWRTGRVRVTLFGSSQKAGPLRPEQAGLSIPDAAFQRGTEISPATFGSAVERTGNLTRIVSNVTLEGAESLNDGLACFWVPADLDIAPGVTVTVTDNVALLVPGYFQNNGVIDGVGRGRPGAAGTTNIANGAGGWYRRGSVWAPENIGRPGYLSIDSTPQGGTAMEVRGGQSQVWPMDNTGSIRTQGAVIGGVLAPGEALPLAEPFDGQEIALPIDLRGSSGSGGGSIIRGGRNASGLQYLGGGGAGGSGGAGLMIVCRGMDQGLNARIDLSGTAGEIPDNGPWSNGVNDKGEAMAGAGGPGGPGACYIFIDGVTNNPPSLTQLNAVANGGDLVWAGNRYPVGAEFRIDPDGRVGVWSSGIGPAPQSAQVATSPAPGVIFWEGAFLVRILTGTIDAEADVPAETENPLRVYLAEITNTPRSANANLSTIEVGVDPPSISNYRYAWVQYRPVGEKGWFDVGPASPEVSFVVSSDGTTYEIRALGVSLDGRRLPDAPVYTITTTRILQPGESPVDDDEPDTVARVPDVSGLELFEQGHDTVFGGRDAKFVWRKTSVTEWFEIGSEGRQGAGAGALDLYFKDYQVEIWAGTKLLRTEWIIDPEFIYSFEKNAEDYYRLHGVAGSWREFECRVYCRGRQNQLSENAARLIVENPAPGLPDQITLSASLRSVQIEFRAPDDLDYKHTRVWLSATQGFEPSDDTLAAQVDGSVAIQGLAPATQYFFRLASYDAFGQGAMSPEFSVTTAQVQNNDIADGSIDLETKVTGQIRGENIEDGAVINITETTASPNTQIFDGSDFDVWKEVATLDVQVLGDGSALALQFHFSFDLDQVTEAWGQAGPGGPMVELRLRRGGVTVWNPDAVMVSGSGRVALQFGAKIDTGLTAGLQTYVVEVLWSKGTYDAGTVDYRVQWNAAGEATILANIAGGGQGLVFNGAFPTTYLGAGWEITFIGTGAVPYPITSAPAVFHPSALGIPTAGWADWRTYSGISVRAPLLDRPPEPAGAAILTDQPYSAENHQHKIIGSLTYYWIRALEYRG